MSSTVLWTIVGIVVLAGIGFWAYSAKAPAPASVNVEAPAGSSETNPASGTGDASTGASVDVGIGDASQAPLRASVAYGANGFSSQEVRIKKGGTVTWTNSGGSAMWVASAQHPTHTIYSGTTLAAHCDDATDVSFDQCKTGSTYSFTFNKVGTWAYHNHNNASHFGKVVVIE